MLLEIGIMFAAYLGTRVYQKTQAKIRNTEKTEKKDITTQKEVGYFQTLKKHNHYYKLSIISLGLSALTQFVYPILTLFSFSLYIYTVIPKIREVEKWLWEEKKLDSELLFLVADTTAIFLNQFFAATIGVFFYHRARITVAKAKGESKKLVFNVLEQQVKKVWILVNQAEVEIPLAEVKINDLVIINTGEMIPVDGKIFEGMATIDQRALTGESQPVEKKSGDQVFASTVVITGKIYIQVEKSGQDTTIAQIGQILNQSTGFKSDLQLKGEQWANKANLPMLGIAGLLLPTLGPVSMSVFLYSHIGGRIKLLAPFGTLNHISLAFHKGILVKDGRALERLIDVDTVLFDKTGTLTHEQPEIKQIFCCQSYSEHEILTYAAAAERKFNHPIAKAILQKARALNLKLPDIEDAKYQLGYGITVKIENQIIRVGSIRFLTMEGIAIPKIIEDFQTHSHNNGHSLVLVAIDNQVGGAIEIQPQLRPAIQETITHLRQQGIKQIAIVSGDHKQPTQKLARQLGMDSFFYEVLPEEKAQIVEQLQKEGKTVCFVGDGINDAIAMKTADVSISLRGANSIATDIAEIILMEDSLSYLNTLFAISKSLQTNLQSSLMLTLGASAVNLSGALLWHFSILTSLIVSGIATTAGITNAMLPLRNIHHEDDIDDIKEV
jgi:Cu2+-exporting ATPase